MTLLWVLAEGEILVCDIEDGEVERIINAGKSVDRMACCEYEGALLCFAATNMNSLGQSNNYQLTMRILMLSRR